jgi:cyclopropane fatty-acyl-phospholipid synthase-like methyltransferase
MDSNSNVKSKDDLKKLYGQEYVENFSKTQSSYRLKRFLKYLGLNKNDRVIDFACGNVMLMEYIAPRVSSYVGVDFSEEFIKEATEKQNYLKLNNVSFVCSEINEFCRNHIQSFECVFALDFFEHVCDKELLEMLISINKALMSNGRLFIHTPNSLFVIEQMKKHSFILKQVPEHIAIHSPEEIAKLLNEAGFSVKKNSSYFLTTT